MNFEILRASGPLGHIELITHLAGVRDIASEGGRPVRVIFNRAVARGRSCHVCFAPKTTELLHRREMSRRADSVEKVRSSARPKLFSLVCAVLKFGCRGPHLLRLNERGKF
jgi:hypothetical protein